jgi:zinc protease
MNQKNPRFIGIIPLEKDWANTDYKKAYDIYKEKFANAGNFHFYFVGNIDEAKFKNEVLQYIASLPSTGKQLLLKIQDTDRLPEIIQKYIKRKRS